MRIDHTQRYFKLTPKGVDLFEEYAKANQAAVKARIEEAQRFLVAHGVPEEEAEAVLSGRTYNPLFPKALRKHLPGLLNKPDDQGWCRLRANAKATKALNKRIEAIAVPRESDYFPTLGIGNLYIMGTYALQVRIGHYGPYVILYGVPKEPVYGEPPYEADEELLEELTLAQWAALVEEVEND